MAVDIEQMAEQRKRKLEVKRAGGEPVNQTEMFMRSAVSSFTRELVGGDAEPSVEAWRMENPNAGTASELLGNLVPYLGAAKATKAARGIEKIDNVYRKFEGDFDKTPLLSHAKKGVATYAPVEAIRVGGTAIANPDELGDSIGEAAINTGIEAAGGLLFGAFAAGGKSLKSVYGLDAGKDLNRPTQYMMRDLKGKIASGEVVGENLAKAQNRLARMEDAIRLEELPLESQTARYVKDLDDGDAQQLNRLFKTGGAKSKKIEKSRLVVSGRDLPDPTTRKRIIEEAGLADNFDAVQFPRYLRADEANAKTLRAALLKQGKMKSVGDNWFWNKEKDGLYVMGKKLVQPEGSKAEEWVLFKTDDPSRFNKEGFKWAKAVNDRLAWQATVPPPKEVLEKLDVYGELAKLSDEIPLVAYEDSLRRGMLAKGADVMADRLGLPRDGSELAKRGRDFVREYFAPTMFKFRHNPRAQRIYSLSRAAHEKAQSMAHGLVYGNEVIAGGRNMFKNIWKTAAAQGKFRGKQSIKAAIHALDDEEFNQFIDLSRQTVHGEALDAMFKEGTVSQNLYDTMKRVEEIDNYMVDQIRQTQGVAGVKEFESLKGHYMMSRAWEGDNRVGIYNEAGQLVYVAASKTKAGAEAKAKEIVKRAEGEGYNLRADDEAKVYNTDEDLMLAAQVRNGSTEYMTAAAMENQLRRDARRPGTFKERKGIEGYKTDYTPDELISKMYGHTLARQNYVAGLSVNSVLEHDLAKLAMEDTNLFRQLRETIDTMQGKAGAFSTIQNAAVDKVLSPVLGKNSATKIVGTANNLMYHLTLGMGNLAFPVLNAMTFMQTVLPRVAFTMTADNPTLARHYSFLPLIGSDARPKGSFGALDMFKMMKNSMREMGNMDNVLKANYERATVDGVVDPKFIEEFGGQKASQVANLKDVLTGKEPYSKFLEAISSFLPTQSERLARGHAFTVGHMIGRDFFNLSDDALYRYAKEFTEQTMFNYGTADRPKVMQGPLGSLFGLFKNWQAHYVSSMLEYAGEGVMRGNWNPLLWHMGGTAALGGVAATPIYGVANAASQWMTDESLMTNIYGMFGGTNPDEMLGGPADAIFHGLPTFLGVSLSGQSAAPLADPARDAGMLFSFVHWDRASALGQAIGASVDAYATTGDHPIDSEEVRDKFIKALAPKNIARAASITEDRAIKSLNSGYPIISGLNVAETMMYSSGFMPRRVALAHEANEELWTKQEKLRNKTQAFGKAWAEAEREKDWDSLHEIRRRAMWEGVDMDSVLRSAKSRKEKAKKDSFERQFDPEDVFKFQRLGIVK